MKIEELDLPLNIEHKNIELDTTYPTIIRVGDFQGSSNQGIIVNQKINYNNDSSSNQISLYERSKGKFSFYCSFDIKKINQNDSPKFGIFFDIDETGTLGVIISSEKKSNYFFYNYIRNVYFVKSKLMNSKDNYYDTDLGTTFRYIVTSKSGERHMDISYQLAQTSDMNIPLPYSLMGLNMTNNYVEYFHTISNTYLESTYKASDAISGDIKQNTPIIPNTQMMLHKYISEDGKKIEWLVDLIVQPMEQIWLFLLIVFVVLIVVLIIIIYLHRKEMKEEQKETTKFKSWFA